MNKQPQSPSHDRRKPSENDRRGRSPLSEGYDKKLNGPNRPSV